MNEIDEEVARLYANLPVFRRKIEASIEIIKKASAYSPYISSSLGKDSAVLTHLVLSVYPDTEVRFLRWKGETEILGNYDEVAGQWADIGVKINQVEIYREEWDSGFFRDDWESIRRDSKAYYLGLRKEESKGRRASLNAHGVIYTLKNGITRICPLAYWSSKDIAAYIYKYNLPLLSLYTSHGIESRTASGLPIHKGHESNILPKVVQELRETNPAGLQTLIERFPELGYYR